MDVLALFIAIIALALAFFVYQKVGGLGDLKKHTETLTKIGESIINATDSLRIKTADVLDKLEAGLRARDTGTKPKPKPETKPEPQDETKKDEEKDEGSSL
jgi:hypothetical protein